MREFPINITVHIESINITVPDAMLDEVVAFPTQKLLDRFAAPGKSTDQVIDEIVHECADAERAAKPKKSRRKSSPENDADMLTQAAEMVAPVAQPHVDHDISAPSIVPPHDNNGEVIPLISASAPELAHLREGLRAIGKEEADDALEFLCEETGRKIERLGQLTVPEVNALLVKIDAWKRTFDL